MTEQQMRWWLEVEVERLTRERDEARQQRDDAWHGLDPDRDAALERGRQLAYVELREERERFQAQRDAALALLERTLLPVEYALEHQPSDAVTGWCDLWDEIKALLSKSQERP